MLFHLNRRLAQKYQKRSALAAQQVKCQHITFLGSRLAVKGTAQNHNRHKDDIKSSQQYTLEIHGGNTNTNQAATNSK